MAIKELAPKQSKTELARQMGVSRQSLYYKPKMPEKDLKLKAEIEKVLSKNKAYGHRRVADDLIINKKRARRVMKLFGLKPQRKRKWKRPEKPMDQGQEPMNIPNLISGLVIDAPHYVWVSDFTYLPYFNKFIYLATIEDVFTRQVVGWEISLRHDTDLVSKALLNALNYYAPPKIIHSDQGSEYRCQDYLNLLKSFNILPSMSRKGSPWQNGYQESFYSGFKFDLGHPEIYPTFGELIEAISQQINYYNNRRIHTALKCPPAIFAKKYELATEKLSMIIK
ncbi:IS3 family transposase [Patescibacteria group bacterium]|nr:IS3 family transposase [Patescibacteria group bacterium]